MQHENIIGYPAVKLSLLVILCKSDFEIPVAFSIPLPRNTNLGAPFSAPTNPFPPPLRISGFSHIHRFVDKRLLGMIVMQSRPQRTKKASENSLKNVRLCLYKVFQQ